MDAGNINTDADSIPFYNVLGEGMEAYPRYQKESKQADLFHFGFVATER